MTEIGEEGLGVAVIYVLGSIGWLCSTHKRRQS